MRIGKLPISLLLFLASDITNALMPNQSIVCDLPVLITAEAPINSNSILIDGWRIQVSTFRNFKWLAGSLIDTKSRLKTDTDQVLTELRRITGDSAVLGLEFEGSCLSFQKKIPLKR